ncbi:hypothetical protein BC826DRAFT_1106287 [Russula brevipes]|nr:hypothetical protein BC826DRAFT_1106287 [Russula brevipes]
MALRLLMLTMSTVVAICINDPPGISTHRYTSFRHTHSCSGMPESQEPMTQEDMKDRLGKELRGATFRADLTAPGAIFDANPNVVHAVCNLVQEEGLASAIINGGDSSETSPQRRRRTFPSERDSYRPFVNLLNIILDATEKCLGPLEQRVLSKI